MTYERNVSCEKIIVKDRARNPALPTTEDYVGKIIAAFPPYIFDGLNDREFCKIQRKIRAVIAEIRREK